MIKQMKNKIIIDLIDSLEKKYDDEYFNLLKKDKRERGLFILTYNEALYDVKKLLKLI